MTLTKSFKKSVSFLTYEPNMRKTPLNLHCLTAIDHSSLEWEIQL